MSNPLSNDDRAILEFLNKDDGRYQYNWWAISGPGIPLFSLKYDLQSLKRRGLVDAEGRGNYRQWWITDKGKERL